MTDYTGRGGYYEDENYRLPRKPHAQIVAEWQAKRDTREAEDARLRQEHQRYREALEKLARLGNGDALGNSIGNTIARDALGI